MQRLKRQRRINEVARRVERLRELWADGDLAPGIRVTPLPVPDPDMNGEVAFKRPKGTRWAKHWWEASLTVAHVDHITSLRLYPFEFPESLRAEALQGETQTLQPGLMQCHALAVNVSMIVPSRLRIRRYWTGPRSASYRVTVEGEYGDSEWLLEIWRAGMDCGVEWHRLDLFESWR